VGLVLFVYMYVFPSLKQLEDFKTWQAYDDVEENFCELDGKVQVIFFFFLVYPPIPPFTPTHPHTHMAMFPWQCPCLICLSVLSVPQQTLP